MGDLQWSVYDRIFTLGGMGTLGPDAAPEADACTLAASVLSLTDSWVGSQILRLQESDQHLTVFS
jgi:hypothetical protein